MGDTRYWHAESVEALANKLIRRYADEIPRLATYQDVPYTARFIFQSDAPTGDGCKAWATCRVIGGLQAVPWHGLAEHEEDILAIPAKVALFRFHYEPWEGAREEWREALVLHELLHYDPLYQTTVPHDHEEFASVEARYGARWKYGRVEPLPLDEG